MATDEPPYLTIGTDVSAKYKGAFCEAKVKKVNKVVRCKVTFKNNLGTFMLTDDQIKGPLRIGADIDAKHPEKNQLCEATINKLQDISSYTVVFDDGDETTLRRTSLCLKSGRHFAESPTLDQFPLTNPEHFGTPVIGTSKFKRKRRSTMNSSIDYESSEDESIPRKVKAIRGKEQNPDLGKVVCVDYGDRRKKDNWYPGLIYPHPAQSSIKLAKEEHLVRSFKDGKYYQVPKKDIREFSKESIQKVENNALKTACEKAISYLENNELPPNWDKALFASLDALSGEEDSQETDSDTSDDEPSEEKDRFVAQLYKFMDERGTPINKAPTVSNRDLNLYKLFKIMHKLGGYNKVTNKNKWKAVYLKMGLPQSNANGPNQIKFAYKRFLQSFEDFYRKLGCTMVSNSRSTRGRHRSDRNIIITRTRDRDTASPKSRAAKDTKEKTATDKKPEEKPKPSDKKDTKPPEDTNTNSSSGSSKVAEDKDTNKTAKNPDKKKTEKQQPPRSEESKEERKPRKEEKPRLSRQASLTKIDKGSRPPPEKARTREDARKEKVDSPEKKGTRSSLKIQEQAAKKEESAAKEVAKKEKKEDKVTPVKPTKKEDKSSSKERKPPPKKTEDKPPTKEKREVPPRDKDKKEDNTKEDKTPVVKEDNNKPKVKKEDPEDKSPKRKMKDKAPKNPIEEKGKEENEGKNVREERTRADSVSSRKGEKPSLKPKKEESLASGDEAVEIAPGDEKDASSSHDSFDRKPPGPRLRAEEGEDPPGKAKRRSLKLDDKDEKESLLGMSDSDGSCTNDSDKNYKEVKHNEIEIGDRVKVKYGRGRLTKVYEAKVLKIEMDGTEKRFYVHYAGWNTRYDEWVRKNYIVANISSTKQQKAEGNSKPSTSLKKVDRGRPPGIAANTNRKNSTSSGCSSSRANTRSEKKTQLSGGLLAKRRTRRKSGTATSATDQSQESDTDAMDAEDDEEDDMSSSFKEELFSDDEDKEKFEDAKISELEKSIGVEEEVFSSEDKKACVKAEVPVKVEDKDSKSTEKPELGSTQKGDTNKTKPEPKAKEAVSTPSPLPFQKTESKAALSFEGLIKKSFDSTVPLQKTSTLKEAVPCEKSPANADKKPDLKKEEPSRSVSLFGSVLSSFQNSTIPTVERETIPKEVAGSFSCISKPVAEVGGFKKQSQAEAKSTTALLNQSQDLKGFPGPVASSLLNPPAIHRSSEAFASTVASPAKLFDSKNLKLEDSKSPIRLDTEMPKSSNFPVAFKVDGAKSIVKLIETKTSSNLAGSRSPSRFGEAKNSAKMDDLKILTKVNEAKNLPKLEDPKIGASLRDAKSFAKLGDTKNLISLTDSKGALNLIDRSSVKSSDGKSPANLLDDKNNFPVVGETKKSGYNKVPVRFAGTKERQAKTGSGNLSKIACETGPAKLSDQARAKIKVTPPISNPSSVPDSIPKSNIPMKSESDMSPANTDKNTHTIPVSETNLPVKSNDPLSKILDLGNTSQKVEVKKDSENKPKDSFDLLLQSSNISYNPSNISDVKDVFNFSFGSASTAKDPPMPFPKYPSSSSDSLCRMTSKSSSETVDVSKMIPGILERLKKDVVSDSKASDSPPPPKEELSFDFLRGQMSSKSLSRSDSSNSLRICESDTNDSNAELKVTPSKFSRLESLPDSSTKLLEAKADLQNVQKPVSEANLSSSSSSNAFTTNIQKSNTPVISQPASVITTTSSSSGKESPPIFDKNNTLSPKVESKEPASFVQANPLTGDTELKDGKKGLLPTSPSSLESSSVVGSAAKKESFTPVDGSQPSETKSESKESSLFDKIKASFAEVKPEAKSEQSSVIKFVSEPSTTASPVSIQAAENFKKEDSKPVKEEEKHLESKETGEDKDISAEDLVVQKDTSTDTASAVPEKESSAEASTTREDSPFSKKDMKKKKLGKKSGKKFPESLEKEGKDKDPKAKDTKIKAKKRLKPEHYDSDKSKSLDLKAKAKKIKKNKKRFPRNDDSFEESMKKFDFKDEDHRTDKLKKSHRKKKFLKSGIKGEESPELKKKKSKKNRDKMAGDKTRNLYEPGKKDFKTKKKRKLQPEEDTDSEKESSISKLKRKKKKFKVSNKDCSSSDEADEEFFKDKASSSYMRQDSSKSDNDPDMSFLLCEEKVDDSSGTSSNEEDLGMAGMDLLPGYPSCSRGRESPNKHSVLDNTPPTTPSSTESLLSSSPSQHDHDLHYPESTQSCEGDPLFHARASEEYRAATTLAFAVCKSVEESQVAGDKGSPSKRKKKRTQRYSSEVAKSPKHKSTFPRVSKVDNYCEDSSGTSPATSSSPPYGNPSTLSFSRSLPHRLSGTSEGSSRYFYVPLHEKDPEKRISVLQDKMAALRKKYMALRAEVIAIDHKRRKARKKVRESGGGAANPSAHSEDGHSGS
ncbi:hypothetical protein JTE90_006923 [Oedothorax gibbosus]|uniref:ARID domain-containing protein n=1 Tax=Oedothorax gibbosus TaxID=931172 RepID=A0AAV6VNW8_9ARAC|nr:hypothetical protein JTE90_006923 [Oedothorax gibbosus]